MESDPLLRLRLSEAWSGGEPLRGELLATEACLLLQRAAEALLPALLAILGARAAGVEREEAYAVFGEARVAVARGLVEGLSELLAGVGGVE